MKLTYLVTLFDRKLQVFYNSSIWTIFGIFDELWTLKMRLFMWFSNTVDFTCRNEVLKFQKKHRNRSIRHDTTRTVCFSWTLLGDVIQNTFHYKSVYVFCGLLRSWRTLIPGPPTCKVPVCGTKNNIRKMTSQWLNCFHLDLLDHQSDPHLHLSCHGRKNHPGFQAGFV